MPQNAETPCACATALAVQCFVIAGDQDEGEHSSREGFLEVGSDVRQAQDAR